MPTAEVNLGHLFIPRNSYSTFPFTPRIGICDKEKFLMGFIMVLFCTFLSKLFASTQQKLLSYMNCLRTFAHPVRKNCQQGPQQTRLDNRHENGLIPVCSL